MDMLKTFLDTSTIHGLSHISSARSRTAKLLWILIVIGGFFGAGYLITSSLKSWSESPITTTVSTHPIADLRFPNITVCPPKDTNTILNLDIALANSSFSNTTKDLLKTAAFDIFIGNDHQKHIKDIKDFFDINHIRHVYMGFGTFPTRLGTVGYEVRFSNTEGKISTPFFGQNIEKEVSEGDKYYHYVLEFADNINEIMGLTGEMVIELTVDVRSTEEGLESVQYTFGERYRYYSHIERWDGAHRVCMEKGGHLVTISSEHEQDEMLAAVKYDMNSDHLTRYWIGASVDQGNTWSWSWSNGEPWAPLKSWGKLDHYEPYCALLGKSNNEFTPASCYEYNPFVCEFETSLHKLNGAENKTFIFSSEDVKARSSLHVWWKYQTLQSLNQTRNKMTGFSLQWYLKDHPQQKTWHSRSLNGNISVPEDGDILTNASSYKYNFELEITESMIAAIGNGQLMVHILANMSEAEQLEYTGPLYKYHNTSSTWEDAQATCVRENGHLVSITSAEDIIMLISLMHDQAVWTGGQIVLDKWQWVGGEKWEFEKWGAIYPIKSQIWTKISLYKSGVFVNKSPLKQLPFICRCMPPMLKGKINKTLTFKSADLTFPLLNLVWQYVSELATAVPNRSLTEQGTTVPHNNLAEPIGFSVSWFIENNHPQTPEKSNVTTFVRKPITKYMTDNQFCSVVAKIQKLHLEGKTKVEIIKMARSTKLSVYKCGSLGMFHSTNDYQNTISDEILLIGLEVYSTIKFCPRMLKESLALTTFINTLLDNHNPRTFIQSIKNTISMNIVVGVENKYKFDVFYHTIEDLLDLHLSQIFPLKIPHEDIKRMSEQNLPFVVSNKTTTVIEKLPKEMSETEILHLSSHPVHLIDKNNNSMPSAFIPFCAYKGDMSIMGKYVDGFVHPVCTGFMPTILNGDLCYTATIPSNLKVERGGRGELMLLLDYNIERSIMPRMLTRKKNNHIINFEGFFDSSTTATVYIQSLASYVGPVPGSYKIWSLKNIQPTMNYRKLPMNVKKCNIEAHEPCMTKKLFEIGFKICGCHLWEFKEYVSEKKMVVCDQLGRDCYNKINIDSSECLPSCNGLYADVQYNNWTQIESHQHNIKLNAIIEEYKRYKETQLENWVFDSSWINVVMKKIPFSQPHLVRISLDTATYDLIEKDVKMTFEAALGVIGGTMGLLTGFSILSGVEIVYFLVKYFCSLISKKN